MAEAIVIETEVVEEKPTLMLFEMAHKTFQAGLGAFALAEEELEHLFGRFVERGEVAEKDGRKLFTGMMERRKKDAESRMASAQDEMESSIERVLHRMSVPSKTDIDNLNTKVTLLTTKVEELLQETA